jgi:hypothetical protein
VQSGLPAGHRFGASGWPLEKKTRGRESPRHCRDIEAPGDVQHDEIFFGFFARPGCAATPCLIGNGVKAADRERMNASTTQAIAGGRDAAMPPGASRYRHNVMPQARRTINA